MTDEELRVRAIQELEFYKKDDTFMLADITVDLAIEALEQEPCDNAVSRQDVLDLAKKGVLVSNGNYESVCKAINELPSVNPQPCGDAIDRAEAIKIASGYCHPANVAKELAKLPSVNPQPCEDAISRQAVIDSLHSKFADGFDSDRWWNSKSVLYAINKVPPVTPQPKTGHWIMSDDGLYRPICDKCGAHPWKGYIPTVEEATEVFKYCPSCGSYNGGD